MSQNRTDFTSRLSLAATYGYHYKLIAAIIEP